MDWQLVARYFTVKSTDFFTVYDGKVSISDRNIFSLQFVNDINALAEEKQGLEALVESVDTICTRQKVEISVEKTKLMTNRVPALQREMKVKEQKPSSVISFKYFGAGVSVRSHKLLQLLHT